jgi:type II secretory pathway component GspD/PulD (secretin)
LSEGEVTTLSGRQANFEVIEVETNQTTAASDATTNNSFGTALDVLPYVETNGYTIELTLIPTITERIEYPAPGNFVPSPITNSALPLTPTLPLPHTRVRQTIISCVVWDGQTAVLLLKPYAAHEKNVVVFVTTTIIDPSGNRKHSDEDFGFAQKAVPLQTAH